jgi:4-hydroxy-tetrahydrodipicolinate synthase
VTGADGSLAAAWKRLTPGRRVHGIAATLLPYTAAGEIHWAAFERHLRRTHASGLEVAVNLDTGFGDLLTAREREAVLDATRAALGAGVRFYAGAYPHEAVGLVPTYREAIGAIEHRGGVPVIVQCPSMHDMPPAKKAALYAEVAACSEHGVLGFELSQRFAPHGEIWDDETFARLLEIPKLLGTKHSSLDRATELRRLAVRDRTRPDFRIYTGNDLAVDMVAYGSDYLLGLATFAPEAFSARDRAMADGDLSWLVINDALQHLGNVAFREPIPAYKHSAALFLHLTGSLTGAAIHPRAPRRTSSDRVLLLDCAIRLGLLEDREKAWRERVEPFL